MIKTKKIEITDLQSWASPAVKKLMDAPTAGVVRWILAYAVEYTGGQVEDQTLAFYLTTQLADPNADCGEIPNRRYFTRPLAVGAKANSYRTEKFAITSELGVWHDGAFTSTTNKMTFYIAYEDVIPT